MPIYKAVMRINDVPTPKQKGYFEKAIGKDFPLGWIITRQGASLAIRAVLNATMGKRDPVRAILGPQVFARKFRPDLSVEVPANDGVLAAVGNGITVAKACNLCGNGPAQERIVSDVVANPAFVLPQPVTTTEAKEAKAVERALEIRRDDDF